MNKKGFTLVELLAVIVLVALMAGLAIPNIMSSINNSHKNTFLYDAKRMASKAEYLISSSKSDRNLAYSSGKVYTFADLNEKAEFDKDADNGAYANSTFVYVSASGDELKYCVCVIGSRRKITGSSGTCSSSSTTAGVDCVLSGNLGSINIVKDN